MDSQPPTNAEQNAVDPYQVSTTTISRQLPLNLHLAAVITGVLVGVLSAIVGVALLWATLAMLLINHDVFNPKDLVLGQLSTVEQACFAFACVLILAAAWFLGQRSKQKTEDGIIRHLDIRRKRNELSQQLSELRTALNQNRNTE